MRVITRVLRLLSATLLLLAADVAADRAAAQQPDPWQDVVQQAAAIPRLHTLIVAQHGVVAIEETFAGPGPDQPVNVKSLGKTVISTLVGMAIDRGMLDGVEQPIAPLLPDSLPADPDPRLARITIGDLLSMRAGLERTSGPNYGRWVASDDWVRFVLSRPFVDDPGGRMLYSTGSSHLLSAILTRLSGRSTRALAHDWLAEPLGFELGGWDRDPQGIYFGGNNMALSPRALLRLGELYRNGGVHDGRRILSEDWVRLSWTKRTSSPFTGDSYGYGWFVTEMAGHPVFYGWGYGGQLLHVVPDLALTVVMTSDIGSPSGRGGYVRDLHRLLERAIIPPAAARLAATPG